ncbi:Golgi membrane 1-like protein [Labeo rohita]|uniref:Golgi membrane 1-like protein n=1 Tax=Labeo rohita TaxID=84645 RepID=A0A498P090_LABRO|nr:Golgi membrane 1-like protein [Labeo rohita]
MMGALGNGRRGGRSPSLLVAALIACILLLGFNYWVSNSRNVELQSKILEMESRMRQLAADRDREQQSKLKAEEETRRQTEQLDLMEEAHQRQQEEALNTWKRERV